MEGFSAFWRRPYDLYKKPKHRRIFALFFAGFTWFMLFVFGVFDFDYYQPLERLYLTGIYALACWLASMLNFFIVHRVFIKKHTLGNTLLLSFSIMATIGLFNYALTTLIFRWELFNVMVLFKNLFFTLAIGMIIAPFLILAHYSYQMRKQAGKHTGRQATKPSAATPFESRKMILLESEYKQGSLELDERDLLFIQTADNYIDVYYLEGSSVRHKLLRSTLSAIEKANISPQVIRCHRSYIINLHHIKSCKRPVRELRLHFKEKDYLIPVSRQYRERVRTSLEHLGNET